MFGATPGTYKNIEAASLAASAYEIEEMEKWIIVYKKLESCGPEENIVYKPCRVNDLQQAEKENWKSLRFENNYVYMKNRINDLSNTFCKDYPNIEKCRVSEKIYAIESSIKGTNEANKECHEIIQILRKKLNITNEEVSKIWESLS